MRVTVSEEGALLEHLKKMQPSTSNNVLRKMLTSQRIQVDESVIYRAKHIVQVGQIIEISTAAKTDRGRETRSFSKRTPSGYHP